jgi:hypothetical protein
MAARRSSPWSVAAPIATPMAGAAAAMAAPIRPRAPLSRMVRGMGVSAAKGGKRPDEGGPAGGLHRAEREADLGLLMIPARASAALIGTGLGSMKSALKSG